MMMIKATGEMGKSVIEGLKQQPLALPLVVVNVLALALVGYVLWIIAERSEARDALITELAKGCVVTAPKT
jgi:hypothetical protein